MTVIDFNTDSGKVTIVLFLQKIKFFKPEIGAYIEHFYCTEQDIVIKLTNGYIKVKESVIRVLTTQQYEFSLQDFENAAITFVKINF